MLFYYDSQQLQCWCHCCRWVICLYKPLGSCEDWQGWVVTRGGGWKLFKTLQALHIYPFHLRKNYSRAPGIKQKSERRRPPQRLCWANTATARGERRLRRQERLQQGSCIGSMQPANLAQPHLQSSRAWKLCFCLFVDNYVDGKMELNMIKDSPAAPPSQCCLVVKISNKMLPVNFRGWNRNPIVGRCSS